MRKVLFAVFGATAVVMYLNGETLVAAMAALFAVKFLIGGLIR